MPVVPVVLVAVVVLVVKKLLRGAEMLPSRKEKTDIQKPSATDTGRRGVGS